VKYPGRKTIGKMTKEECLAVQAEIGACPDARNTDPSCPHLFQPRARMCLNELAERIAFIIREERISRGEKVNTDGYSGRKQNKR